MEQTDKINKLLLEGENYLFINNNYIDKYGDKYSRASSDMQAWIAECEDYISSNYGKESAPWKVYNQFKIEALNGNYQDTFDKEKAHIISALKACLRIAPKYTDNIEIGNTNNKFNLTKVFIVHGHDIELKNDVELFLKSINLKPIVLHRELDEGLTVIEKFEKHSDVKYAIILLTPDDIGYMKTEFSKGEPILEFRARQNVIFEFGFFIGKLNRKNVCCIYKDGVILPSDINGFIYKKVDKSVEEIGIFLLRELKNAGLKVKYE